LENYEIVERAQEIKTKEWLVSVSKVLVDEENDITGMLAVDTLLEKLENILWSSDEGYRSSLCNKRRPADYYSL
jgi:hypothetical protein